MKKAEIIAKLRSNHHSFIEFMKGLDKLEFDYRITDKWSARDQLDHLTMGLKSLVRIYEMPVLAIDQAFGKTTHPNRDYNSLKAAYLQELREGGKAPI